MQARALARYVRSSPRKMRRVVDVVRGEPVQKALSVLSFMPQSASVPVMKTLKSAVANAINIAGPNLHMDDLYVKEAYVNQGPTMKRFRPRAMGRASRIRKRSSHLTIVVADHQT
ncbi:50S ribosomal protein L22 [bacterium]|nr:50S ribosomal protein L22 [bacterium]